MEIRCLENLLSRVCSHSAINTDSHAMNIGTNIARSRDISMQDQDMVTKWIEDCGEVEGGKIALRARNSAARKC